MGKLKVKCSWCGQIIERYPSQLKVNKHNYCSKQCRSLSISKKSNPEGYTKHPHLSFYNQATNPNKMTPEIRRKLRTARLGTGLGVSYVKFYGRHLHRVVAEMKIGRALMPGEIVHHIDGNIHNNSPENLMVLPNQASHAKLHGLKRGDAL